MVWKAQAKEHEVGKVPNDTIIEWGLPATNATTGGATLGDYQYYCCGWVQSGAPTSMVAFVLAPIAAFVHHWFYLMFWSGALSLTLSFAFESSC